MMLEDIQSVLIDDAEYDEQDVLTMSPFELIDKWLTWEGICGYTGDIITAVLSAYGHEDEAEKV